MTGDGGLFSRAAVSAEVSGAELSADGCYRYALWRFWGTGSPATFVMLNPSTADASEDDATIRRCRGFARAWGLSGIFVVNLYAWRATKPEALWAAEDPVGPLADTWLAHTGSSAARRDAPLVAAWGVNARQDRVDAVRALPGFGRLSCLGVTAGGAPRHPLYVRGGTELQRWPA